jgi:hypothetical protein
MTRGVFWFLFLILVCTATLAGRPISDLDEYFTLITGLIGLVGLYVESV